MPDPILLSLQKLPAHDNDEDYFSMFPESGFMDTAPTKDSDAKPLTMALQALLKFVKIEDRLSVERELPLKQARTVNTPVKVKAR
jgi:hypothetical protein